MNKTIITTSVLGILLVGGFVAGQGLLSSKDIAVSKDVAASSTTAVSAPSAVAAPSAELLAVVAAAKSGDPAASATAYVATTKKFGQVRAGLSVLSKSGKTPEIKSAYAAICSAAHMTYKTADSALLLAGVTFRGYGVERDPNVAFGLLNMPELETKPAAQYLKGRIYLDKKFAKADKALGLELLNKSAASGYAPAIKLVAKLK